MMRCQWSAAVAAVCVLVGGVSSSAAEPAPGKVRVAVVTGGHGFDPKTFFALFEGYPDVVHTSVAQKVGGELFANIDDFPYDAIVFYNFNQKMNAAEQANFKKLLDRGVGLVVLHHAGAAYPAWPEFGQIGGGCFHLQPYEENGVKKPGSGVKFGVKYKVHVADRNHPITKGLEDFEITDETYIRCSIQPDLQPLLTTEEPSSDKVVGGVRTQGKARVFYCQLGHDAKVYACPAFRSVMIRAVRWVANRPTEP
jgi:uncharacterized protein